jgi:hypothetical protein
VDFDWLHLPTPMLGMSPPRPTAALPASLPPRPGYDPSQPASNQAAQTAPQPRARAAPAPAPPQPRRTPRARSVCVSPRRVMLVCCDPSLSSRCRRRRRANFSRANSAPITCWSVIRRDMRGKPRSIHLKPNAVSENSHLVWMGRAGLPPSPFKALLTPSGWSGVATVSTTKEMKKRHGVYAKREPACKSPEPSAVRAALLSVRKKVRVGGVAGWGDARDVRGVQMDQLRRHGHRRRREIRDQVGAADGTAERQHQRASAAVGHQHEPRAEGSRLPALQQHVALRHARQACDERRVRVRLLREPCVVAVVGWGRRHAVVRFPGDVLLDLSVLVVRRLPLPVLGVPSLCVAPLGSDPSPSHPPWSRGRCRS